ncbi:hypothetical protein [Catellatospora tritici]|uniref:hypothetical protein n=1 Tax=Catellatospora tritici TaxID=2851566 RepID=UPI001C2DCC73|nr:hypothetical protein [Catellatospora tritici]MBV1854779.1 hypothetical protein [Catellatospora tritici]
MAYPDGTVRQQFNLCLRARLLGGVITTSDESPQVAWLSRAELAGLPVHPSIRLRLEHGYADRAEPYVG